MNHLSFEPLSYKDFSCLESLHRLCFPDDPWNSAVFSSLFANSQARGIKACLPLGGNIASQFSSPCETPSMDVIGFLLWRWVDKEGEILTLGVNPSYRSAGIARALLNQFFAISREQKVERIVLEVAQDNDPAYHLYCKLGFSKIGLRKNYYARADHRVDAMVMALDLQTKSDGPHRENL